MALNQRPIQSTIRNKTLRKVAAKIFKMAPADRIALVAVDGVDDAGKATLADELADVLRTSGGNSSDGRWLPQPPCYP
jgi:hypothetical protein